MSARERVFAARALRFDERELVAIFRTLEPGGREIALGSIREQARYHREQLDAGRDQRTGRVSS